MENWQDLPFDQPLFRNVDDSAVATYATGRENAYRTGVTGNARFPGLELFADLTDGGKSNPGRVYLNDWNGDLIASTSKGQTFRVDRRARVQEASQAPVQGGRRTIFAKTDKELLMAAGGSIVRLRGEQTELLSPDAPKATHVAWIDNITIANEINSQRWYHSAAGFPDQWNPLDTFSADGSPDAINGMIVTPFREIIIAGPASIEQFDRADTGTAPFLRRFAIGDGVSAPYAMVFADNAVWTVNNLLEVVRFSGQVSQSESSAIGRMLERVDDWSDAWMGGYPDRPFHVEGQKFIILQLPNATNAYGTKGITLVLDYAQKDWFELYGWNEDDATPERWPGWSHWTLWNQIFVGGEGKIYRVTKDRFTHDGKTQRWLLRSGILQIGHKMHIKALRLYVKRGMGGSDTASEISVSCSRDAKPFGTRIRRSLGRAGQRQPFVEFGQFGIGYTFQFEISCSADVEIELMKVQYKGDPIGL